MIVGDTPTFWIGLDDTDEREFGCTTFDFNDLLNHLRESGFTIYDPCLVRLWPFAPTRTRGNAALAAQIITTAIDTLETSLDDWFNARFGNLESGSEAHSAQPVLLLTRVQLPDSMYWDTVTGYVELEHRVQELQAYSHRIWSTSSGFGGIIGASAAIAWRGNSDFTWECTAWREKFGQRQVPTKIVTEMSKMFPSTFLNRDPNAGHSLIAPRTPCPVLYGIRGETKQGVLDAHRYLQENGSEISIDFRVHRSNQATDDHLQGSEQGIVENIRVMQGGHVEIQAGKVLLSFSQGGELNKLCQQLTVGDHIEWFGLSNFDGTVHLERLRLIRGERNRTRPNCICGQRFKSKGKNQPLRCPNCGAISPDSWDSEFIDSDWQEPPPSHRRHLSKPLSRMGKSEV